jgi:hypothetical protein
MFFFKEGIVRSDGAWYRRVKQWKLVIKSKSSRTIGKSLIIIDCVLLKLCFLSIFQIKCGTSEEVHEAGLPYDQHYHSILQPM